MINVTIEQLKEVFNRNKVRKQVFEVYIDEFQKQLDAKKQEDGSFQIDNAVGEYVWDAAYRSKSLEEYKERITGLINKYEITIDTNGNEIGRIDHLDNEYIRNNK